MAQPIYHLTANEVPDSTVGYSLARSYLGYEFTAADESAVFVLKQDSIQLNLPRLPVNTITSWHYEDEPQDVQELVATQFALIKKDGCAFRSGRHVINYAGGYALADRPVAIIKALEALAEFSITAGSIDSASYDSLSVNLPPMGSSPLSLSIMQTLATYKRVGI